MSALDYAGTQLVGVRRAEGGVKVSVLREHSEVLMLTLDEWEDLVHLAVLFLERSKGNL